MNKIQIWFENKKIGQYLLPLGIYSTGRLTSYLLGFDQFAIDWNLWQLLDKKLILESPLQSLVLLHAQPPAFNSLFIIILKFSSLINLKPELISSILFFIFGLTTSYFLYQTIILLTDSTILAILSSLVFSYNPATWYFGSLFFYPFILVTLFAVLAYLILEFITTTGKTENRYLSLIVINLALISSFRSLYTPLWGIILFGFIIIPKYMRISNSNRRKKQFYGILTFLFTLSIFIWPIKNKIVFNQFSSSSWVGYNLSRDTDLSISIIDEYVKYGHIPAQVEEELSLFQNNLNLTEPNVLSQRTKSTGGRNWNHYIFLVTNTSLKSAGLKYRIVNPLHWIKQTIYHYLTWTRPSFEDSYSLKLLGPTNPFYSQYTSLIRSIFFYNLRPLLSQIEPSNIEWPHVIRLNKDVPYTLFGIIYFPLIVFFSVKITINNFRNGKKDRGYFFLILLYCITWVLIITCLTDGNEGNRMRFAVFPYLVIFVMAMLKNMLDRFQNKLDENVIRNKT